MELQLGPFDPALHIKSRDHYEAVRREAQLVALSPETPPARFTDLIERLGRQFPHSPVDDVADRAFLARESAFTARYSLPDELVPAALQACDELEALLKELDGWAGPDQLQLPKAPEDVKHYLEAYLAQARAQLQGAAG
jgi:hypothetical protein